MDKQVTLLAVCAALLLSVCLTAAPAQITPPQNQPGQAQQADKMWEGSLTKVDLPAKQITVKGNDGKEMSFVYDDKTQMSGIDNTPQGLSGKTGSNLKVSYRENRGSNLATRIEVQDKK